MITGTAQGKNGRKLILIGVERENVNRLVGGRPIFVNPENHAVPEDLEILIFFGEGPDELKAELEKAGIDLSGLINRRDEGEKTS